MADGLISETHKFINFIKSKYDIDNKNFDEYLASMIAYLAHDIKTIQIYCFKVYGVWYPKEPGYIYRQ